MDINSSEKVTKQMENGMLVLDAMETTQLLLPQ